MKNIKIKVLKDFRASTNGVNSQEFKAGEILELGTQRLTMDLFNWFTRNMGYGELYEEKAISEAPENKMMDSEELENKSLNKKRK